MTRLYYRFHAGILVLLLIALNSACTQEQGYPEFDSALERFGTQLAEGVAADSIGAISAGVVVGDQVIWGRGFGWADRERQIPADAETIYRTGSISKSFTAVLMVRLASHTAGLVREPQLRRAAAGPISSWEDKIIASIPTTSFQDPPGVRYSYSNIGFGILGLTISRAAGSSFIKLVHEMIFDPLGMKSSTFIITPELQGRLSTGYAVRRGGGNRHGFSCAGARRQGIQGSQRRHIFNGWGPGPVHFCTDRCLQNRNHFRGRQKHDAALPDSGQSLQQW